MGTAVPQQGDHARPASPKGCSENYPNATEFSWNRSPGVLRV